jgi:cytidylate kinase
MTKKQTTIVTISRQTASGGAYIGHLLAGKLGYKYVEREVLYKAAENLGVEIADLKQSDECSSSFVENLMKSFVFGTPEAASVPPSRRPIYDQELFEVESRIITAIADQYDSVIVGRGGYFMLRERPNVVNVLIHAPMDFRIKRFRKWHPASEDQAREEITSTDRQREKYLKNMTNTDWYDARNYHFCLDAEAVGFETAVRMIIDLVKNIKH